MAKVAKIIVSSRVHPDVKFELDEEAESIGITTSKYLEQIIENRFDTPEEVNQEDSEDAVEKDARIQELETANENMSSQLDAYEEEYNALNEQLQTLQTSVAESATKLPFKFEQGELEQLNLSLEKLRALHPEVTDNMLLIGALDTTLRTENAVWMIPTIARFINAQKRAS